MSEAVDVLAALQEDKYRWNDLQAIRYAKDNKFFPDEYLAHIYNRCRESKRRSGDGILTTVFGGNPASDFNSVITFLAQRQVVILGKWAGDKFHDLGFAFSIIACGAPTSEHSLFAGYGFFKNAWGREDQTIVTMLGLACLFKEFDLQAIHGIRFKENLLTAKFMAKFGFKQTGEIPYYQLRNGKLVPGVVSTLLRTDFEEYVKQFLIAEYRKEGEHPPVEETPDTIDAQVERLGARQIPVVYFPPNTTYMPAIPEGIDLCVVSEGYPGTGIYFFDPHQVSREEIEDAAAAGTHGRLLGHVQDKVQAVFTGPTLVVQAIDANGVVLQDSVVSATAEAVAAQVDAFKIRYPDCECRARKPEDVIAARKLAK